jgi:uncharacterized membrane protein
LIVVIHAKSLTNDTQPKQPQNIPRTRIGIQVGTGILSGSHKVGLFGEYKIARWIGLQTGLFYLRNQ